ncbi:kinesin-like protein KIN-4C isoform X2 [Rosa chinensis]|uniref:kinesin-like protein KIN-4C isoform X2 n=1 Tax=Rosa chinensis TaxID=74649 RepID=UPI001AD91188|nr:kinesin-like protein KIN-4C isoform X2 [Rosa chinensis]
MLPTKILILNSALKKCENGHKYDLRKLQLDSVDVGEPLNDNAAEGDQHQNLHQADPEDITLPKCYDPSDAHADLFNPRFERFEIEGDNVDLTSGEPTHIRPPSPPRQDQHQEGQQANNVFAEVVQMQDVQEIAQQRQRPIRRRKRKTPETSSLKDFFTETSGHNAHGIQALMQAMELELEVTVKTHEVRSEYERQIEERAMMAKERTKLIEEQRNLSDSSEIMSPGARNSRIFALENMLATSSSTMVSTA